MLGPVQAPLQLACRLKPGVTSSLPIFRSALFVLLNGTDELTAPQFHFSQRIFWIRSHREVSISYLLTRHTFRARIRLICKARCVIGSHTLHSSPEKRDLKFTSG